MKKNLNSLFTAILTTVFLIIIIGIGIFAFSLLLTQGLSYTFHINLNVRGVFLLSFAAVLGLDFLITMFKK